MPLLPAVPPPVSATLPVRTSPPTFLPVGAGSIVFPSAAPTIIEAWTGSNLSATPADALPWGLQVQSTAGGQLGPVFGVTVRTAIRTCLFGDVFTISAANLADTANPVWVRAYQVPTMLPTRNVLEVGAALPGAGSSTDIVVPTLAQAFRWDVPESEKGSVFVRVLSGATGHPTVAQYAWNEQPSDGIPVGGAYAIELHNGTGSARFDFYLGA